jgi:putative membrane protein
VVAAIVLIVRVVSGSGSAAPPVTGSDPRLILAERLAHGQIDETEYRNRLDTLRGSRTSTR